MLFRHIRLIGCQFLETRREDRWSKNHFIWKCCEGRRSRGSKKKLRSYGFWSFKKKKCCWWEATSHPAKWAPWSKLSSKNLLNWIRDNHSHRREELEIFRLLKTFRLNMKTKHSTKINNHPNLNRPLVSRTILSEKSKFRA